MKDDIKEIITDLNILEVDVYVVFLNIYHHIQMVWEHAQPEENIKAKSKAHSETKESRMAFKLEEFILANQALHLHHKGKTKIIYIWNITKNTENMLKKIGIKDDNRLPDPVGPITSMLLFSSSTTSSVESDLTFPDSPDCLTFHVTY